LIGTGALCFRLRLPLLLLLLLLLGLVGVELLLLLLGLVGLPPAGLLAWRARKGGGELEEALSPQQGVLFLVPFLVFAFVFL
jgi:hypothetical protein